MKRAILLFVISVIIGLCLSIGVAYVINSKDKTINPKNKTSFTNTCMVVMHHPMYGDNIGSGVLLNTGFVITAAHCIDVNNNGVLDITERDIDVHFYGASPLIKKAQVVFCGKIDKNDIAILSIEDPQESSASLSDSPTIFGDRLHAVGCTNGVEPHITYGYSSTQTTELKRASVTVWKGNSGGGLWNEDEEVIGIVTRTQYFWTYSTINIAIPTERGMMMMSIRQTIPHPSANWCEYVSSEQIKKCLNEKKLAFIYKKEQDRFNVNPYYITMLIEVMMVVCCAWYLRRHILS